MKSLMLLLIAFVFGDAFQPQSDIPPPLGVSSYSINPDFFVIDFATGEAISASGIDTDNPSHGNFNNDDYAQSEIVFSSPYDSSLRFALRLDNDSIDKTDVGGFNLYQFSTNEEPQLIVENVWTGEIPYWSPDGHYLYAITNDQFAPSILYQYDIQTGDLVEVVRDAGRLVSCNQSNEWCVFNWRKAEIANTLYLLNKNDGYTIELATGGAYSSFEWDDATPDFIFVMSVNQARSIRSYNYQDEVAKTIITLSKVEIYQLAKSPDGQWLAFQTRALGIESDVLVVNLESSTPTVIQVTTGTEVSARVYGLWDSYPFPLQWSPIDTTLIYSMEKDGRQGLYAMSIGEEPRKLFDFYGTRVVDDALSPDGRWLAISLDEFSGVNHEVYVIPIAGGKPINVSVPVDTDHIICVGWFEESVYTSGQAEICDKDWDRG